MTSRMGLPMKSQQVSRRERRMKALTALEIIDTQIAKLQQLSQMEDGKPFNEIVHIPKLNALKESADDLLDWVIKRKV